MIAYWTKITPNTRSRLWRSICCWHRQLQVATLATHGESEPNTLVACCCLLTWSSLLVARRHRPQLGGRPHKRTSTRTNTLASLQATTTTTTMTTRQPQTGSTRFARAARAYGARAARRQAARACRSCVVSLVEFGGSFSLAFVTSSLPP